MIQSVEHKTVKNDFKQTSKRSGNAFADKSTNI